MTKPSAGFWNRFAKRYAKSPVKDEAAYQEKLKITQSYLKPDMEIMEFGCGTGSTAIIHAPFVANILATDISQNMLDIARGKAKSAKISNVTFQHADIEEFTYPDASFDAVLGMSILHLLVDKDAAIAKVFGLLKPGGVFVSSTVCIGDAGGLLRFVLPLGRAIGLLPLVRFFTPDELVASLTDAGFTIDHRWQAGKGRDKVMFIVAKKPG